MRPIRPLPAPWPERLSQVAAPHQFGTASVTVVINTIGSNFGTLLAVYRGRTVQTLTLVKQNDDRRPGQFTSRVQFVAIAGQRYRIAVDGYNPPGAGTPADEGGVVLTLRWR